MKTPTRRDSQPRPLVGDHGAAHSASSLVVGGSSPRMTTFRKVTLMVAGALWFLVLVSFYFVVPIFAAMFADFGAALPLPTQLVIDWAAFVRSYPIVAGLGGIAIILVGADIERRDSVVGVRLFATFSVVAVAAVVIALFLPILRLGAVAEGLAQ